MAMNQKLLRPRAGGFGAIASAYFAAVAAADGAQLEAGVKKAINNFILGCTADGTFSAIKSACILSGARTLAGALVPLVGTAPTNANFVSGDYNRKTGLVGNASNKYLNTNRANNADPQDNKHVCVYISALGTGVYAAFGAGGGSTGATNFYHVIASYIAARLHTSTGSNFGLPAVGLNGVSRSNSASYTARASGANNTLTVASQVPISNNIYIYANNNAPTASEPGAPRIAFYSIGESLDLALLDTRVSALYAAITAAIP